jgi:hypothetical protein
LFSEVVMLKGWETGAARVLGEVGQQDSVVTHFTRYMQMRSFISLKEQPATFLHKLV